MGKEFIKKIAIFPFDYNGEDKTYDYLKYGFPFGCCVSLLQDPLVEIEFPNDMELDGWIFNYKLQKAGFEKGENVPLPLKKKIAKELHCNYFVSGNINVVENKIHIISKVYETKNGKQINENKIENTIQKILIRLDKASNTKELSKNQEVDTFKKYAAENVTTAFLPVIDNVAIACEHANKNDQAEADIIQGFLLIQKQILLNQNLKLYTQTSS